MEGRNLRAEVEKVAEGAGTIARQLAQAKVALAQLQTRSKLVNERTARLKQLRAGRDRRLAELETIRNSRTANRARAAEAISAALAPQIKIEVEPLGQFNDYARALSEALRGSGLRYSDLAQRISERISPRELTTFIDNSDYLGLAEAAELPKDRSARLLGHLREAGPAEIVTSKIDDNVRMLLLDGIAYKSVEELSAGQRCTIVLSMVLQHSERMLIIDQQEDHLDNAYIASTVVKALLNRTPETQIILSTHNANIPVLGNAELVIELTSDGRHGYVQVCKPLHHIDAVDAITKVMEGGIKAFEKRAEFYGEHSPL
jgi:ATPase subunit of ABC transporter with duplicated ATPase domains